MAKENNRMISYEIKARLGVISKYETGWTKELNLISWNNQPPKFDIRDWDEEHNRMSRGVTLHTHEMKNMVDLFTQFKEAQNEEEVPIEGMEFNAEGLVNVEGNLEEGVPF